MSSYSMQIDTERVTVPLTTSAGADDTVPRAARALLLFSDDAAASRQRLYGEASPRQETTPEQTQTQSPRPYKFVPKREDDRILISAFRYAVTTARNKGLTNEHISMQIGNNGMSANLISKIVHGHRGLGRFRKAVSAWTQSFCGKSLDELCVDDDLLRKNRALESQRAQEQIRHIREIAGRTSPPTIILPDSLAPYSVQGQLLEKQQQPTQEISGELCSNAVTGHNQGPRLLGKKQTQPCQALGIYSNLLPIHSQSPTESNSSGISLSSKTMTPRRAFKMEQERVLIDQFRQAVAEARRHGWTNERIALEIGALNANVVSKLIHGRQAVGRYREKVASWTQHMVHFVEQLAVSQRNAA